MSEALETTGRRYPIVFSSESTAGVKTAIRNGIAVGTLAFSTLDDDSRLLREDHGLPALLDSVLPLAC